MDSCAVPIEYELIHVIVNLGLGSKVLQTAKSCGVSGGTGYLGRGTVCGKIIEFLGLTDVRKEIILMGAEKQIARQAMHKIDEEFKLDKPNHGIAFTTSIGKVAGTRSCKSDTINEEGRTGLIMYQLITVIVDKGLAEDVIDAATAAGAQGGTIINGRGSGIHETSKVFSMDIEPEKEIVMILSEKQKTDEIVSSIYRTMKMDQPGNGIIFTQDVKKTYGLFQ